MIKYFNLIIFTLLFSTVASFGQSDSIPKAIWRSRADYKASEALVIQYMRDIENNPVSDLENKEKSNYVLRWILGCPYVALKLKNDYFEKILVDKNYHYANYVAYGLLFGEVLYYLENPFDRNKTNALRSGVYYAMDMYKKLKVHDDSSTCGIMEAFIRLDNENTLNKFIFLDN